MSFVNLHSHSHYSLLDGFGSPRDIVLRAKELGAPAAALTDHGVTFGLIEFYNAAKAEGIKPILGSELYVAGRTRFDKESGVDNKPYHLTILAKNNTGYENLLKLVSKAHLEGFYYKPRVDYGLLKAYGEGLIALSGCLAGNLAKAILAGDDEAVDEVILKHIDIFGKENYFLEMQDHPLIESQGILNTKLKVLAKKYDLQLVATNDSHYPRSNDKDVHDIMICIQTQTNVHDEGRMRYTGDFSTRSAEEMLLAFPDCPEAISNTLKIADMCDVTLEFGNYLLPSFKTPHQENPDDYLKTIAYEGLSARFLGSDIPDGYEERLEYELSVVNKMGFSTYFLIVYDFVKYARDLEIVVGPGRGSAAGSILAWSLNITDLDPIKYGLFFERFLNPERISMPDIDIDFSDDRRDEVLKYVIDKYGRDNVAQIITFGTMAPRAAVRDVGRALGYPYAEVDKLAKIVPPPVLGKHVPLKNSIVDDAELKSLYQSDPRAKVLLDYAMRLEGAVRHSGTHACAVVISDEPLTSYTALQYGSGGGGEIVTQYSAEPLEKLGLLKMDFLGLRNLTVIDTAVKLAARTRGVKIDINTIPLDDGDTFEVFQRGDTTGVFQFESPGMRRYLKQLKPTKFDDIVAMGALYRPGPMDWIPTYIRGKHDPLSVKYLDPSFKEILESTYGVAVYQEQILQLARDFAGFSLGEADLLRKAVGKKIPELLEEQRVQFVAGAVKNGHKEKFANEVFEKVIEPFAGYGFNKAHAACYGLIAYRTAYLKAHFPIEFMTALLRSDAGNTDRVVLEIKECSQVGVSVLQPDINESEANFTVISEDTIRFGFLAIKGVGEGPIDEIVSERDRGGPYKNLDDFCKRVPLKVLNKKVIQSLAYAGAFDCFGDRIQIAESYDEIAKFAKSVQDSTRNGQTDIFGMMDVSESSSSELALKKIVPTPLSKRLKLEKEILGMYVSGHPLRGLNSYLSSNGRLISSLNVRHVNKPVKVRGLVSSFKKIMTKSGGYIATFVVEDTSARLNAIIFPQTMKKIPLDLQDDCLIAVSGKLDNRREQFQLIVDEIKILSLSSMVDSALREGMYHPDEKFEVAVPFLDDLLAESDDSILEVTEDKVTTGTQSPGRVSPESSDEAFVIEIPDASSPEILAELKKLLLENAGDKTVDIFLASIKKRIRLPFGVKIDDDLKRKISQLVGYR